MKEAENIQNIQYELPQYEKIDEKEQRNNRTEFFNLYTIAAESLDEKRKTDTYANPSYQNANGITYQVYDPISVTYLLNPIKRMDYKPVADKELFKTFEKDMAEAYAQLEKNIDAALEDPATMDLYVKAANAELKRAYEARENARKELEDAQKSLERAKQNRERAQKDLEEARGNLQKAELERDLVYNPFAHNMGAEGAAEKVTEAENALKAAETAIKEAEQSVKEKDAAEKKTVPVYDKAAKLAGLDSFNTYKEKARRFLKAHSLGEMKREMDGDTYPYLSGVNLMFAAVKTHQAMLDTGIDTNLIYKMAVADEALPVYDMILKTEEHVETYTDYLHTKENGNMTPEKEQEYREKLYRQAREAASLSSQYSEAVKNPETNKFFHDLRVTDEKNEPFELSKYSARGIGRLDASIQAHITGLENNWKIEDLGTLVAFNMARDSINCDAMYKRGLGIDGFEEREEPEYGSPEKAEFAGRMNELFEKIDSIPLSDNSHRNEILGQMHDLMAEGSTRGFIEKEYTETFARSYQKSMERNALIEAGKEAAVVPLPPYGRVDLGVTEENMRMFMRDEAANLLWGVASALDKKFEVKLPEELEEGGELYEAAYGEGLTTTVPAIGHGTSKASEVVDRKALEQFRDLSRETADEWDALIHEALPDHPYAQKMEAALKATTTNRLRLAADGFTDVYMTATNPVFSGVKSLIADTGIVFNDKLGTVMEECKDTFPVFDCIIQGDEHLQTTVDYQKECESGTMTPEKTEEYRRTMYAQAAALLPKVKQLSDTVVNNRPETDRLHELGVTQNDPFQLGKYSARGCLGLEAGLEAELHGLKNGWAIEDLNALSAFNFIRQHERGNYEYNKATTFANFQRFDPPQYPSEECRQYFDKMDAAFKAFKETPVQSKEDRLKILNGMQKLIETGIEKKYLSNSGSVRVGKELLQKARLRDDAIAKGKIPAAYEALGQNNTLVFKSQIEGKAAFETKRSKAFLGRESAEHKALRESYEGLTEAKNALGFPPTTEQMRAYLDQIDLVELNAKIYQKERAGASSEAGKERLKGAQKLESFAVKERKRFMDLLNKDKKPEEQISLKTFRKLQASDAANHALTEFENMDKLPAKGDAKEEAMSMMADVLVHQLAGSRQDSTAKVFEEKGMSVLKQEVMKNSAFQKMADSYLNGKKTGAELCNDLMSGKCMKKIGKMREKLNEQQKEKDKKMEEAKYKPKKKAAAKQA
ncbi:MAG: hypothetical protein K6E84_04265 [Lachnospiraceae bacterium]|nr:hypothetical protein [Lachnospiraceae bacterium]